MTTPPSEPYWSPTPPIGDQPYTDVDADGPAPQPAEKHRRWPWVLGIVLALVVGAYLGASDEDATALAAAERQLADLQLSLDGTQDQLAKVAAERDAALEDLESVSADRDTARADLTAAEADRDEAIGRAEDAEAALAANEGARAAAEAAQERAEEDDAEPAEQFDDGTWVVGADIAAGVYRNESGAGCYWERLSGLSGEFGDIIANGLPDGPTVVEVVGSDTAFSSQRCGTWTRQ